MGVKGFLRAWLRLLAILGGSGGIITGVSCCGGMPGPAHLKSAQLTSPAALASQSKITALATTDYSPIGWRLQMKVAKLPADGGPEITVTRVDMRDDGRHGDKVKEDAEWYAEYKGEWEPGAVYHVAIELYDNHLSPQVIILPEDIALTGSVPAPRAIQEDEGKGE